MNAIDTMIKDGVEDVEYVAINTDAQHLKRSLADIKLALNTNTRGHGAGVTRMLVGLQQRLRKNVSENSLRAPNCLYWQLGWVVELGQGPH